MKLHENIALFEQAVRTTAQQKGLLEIYIEKDYWVTLALHTIFHHKIGQETIFKGGTALSKCYGLIDRFSEDIDLIALRKEGESNNQLKNKIKQISEVVAKVIPEIEVEGVTHKMGMNRKTAHAYNKVFDGKFGQVRDVIIIEATWLGHFEPFIQKTISCYIYEMMMTIGQEELAEEYGLLPFEVLVLDVKRTLCEKIMSLVRFSYTDQPITDLNNKIRHTYDIYQLLQNKEINEFFLSAAFDEMLLKVAQDDVVSFKNNNEWLKYHPIEALIFGQVENTWKLIKSTYSGSFKDMVFGEVPDEGKILETLVMVSQRLKKVEWKIEFDTDNYKRLK